MNYITLYPGQTAAIVMKGYFFDATSFVLLSCSDNTVFPYVSVINLFPLSGHLNSSFPQISGYPWQNYNNLNFNQMSINVYNLPADNIYDIVVGNRAGYSKLSKKDYSIITLDAS